MGINAALYSGSKYYFFAGTDYVRVTRDDEGPGTVDPGYPRSISSGWHSFPAGFGERIDAALYSPGKYYFFDGPRYIRVSHDGIGPGTLDPGYPKTISPGWSSFPNGFGAAKIDAALYTQGKYYFFDGPRYIRVSHNGIGPGTLDPGYPKMISPGWSSFPNGFGAAGIDAALNSGNKFFFFAGHEFIRVSHDGVGPGTLDPGFPKKIYEWWGWPGMFGTE